MALYSLDGGGPIDQAIGEWQGAVPAEWLEYAGKIPEAFEAIGDIANAASEAASGSYGSAYGAANAGISALAASQGWKQEGTPPEVKFNVGDPMLQSAVWRTFFKLRGTPANNPAGTFNSAHLPKALKNKHSKWRQLQRDTIRAWDPPPFTASWKSSPAARELYKGLVYHVMGLEFASGKYFDVSNATFETRAKILDGIGDNDTVIGGILNEDLAMLQAE